MRAFCTDCGNPHDAKHSPCVWDNGQPYRGGIEIGRTVKVSGSTLRGEVLEFVPNAPDVVVDHGGFTRVHHWIDLDYID